MVIGFVIHTIAIVIGRFIRIIIAAMAANSIWNGTGTKAKNNPTPTAPDTERRLRCSKKGS